MNRQDFAGFMGALDWMGWLWRVIRNTWHRLTKGPVMRVSVPAEGHTYSGKDVRRILRENGVPCWGLNFDAYAYAYTFFIARADSETAAAILASLQVPDSLQVDVARTAKPRGIGGILRGLGV